MAHFAQVENGVVRQVIVVSNDDCAGGDLPESEPAGQAFLANIGLEGHWVQTSYHANFRGKYAGIGDLWNGTDFVSPEVSE
jgi:hypothetical protein